MALEIAPTPSGSPETCARIALARRAADMGDDGTNDLLAGDVIRTHEKQSWFVREHLK